MYQLRQALALDEPGTPVKVIEPYQMLCETTLDLSGTVGGDVVGVGTRHNMFGFKNKNRKPWTFHDGTPLLVPEKVNTQPEPIGDMALDLHPADGVYSEKPGCNQWHSRGVYQIPYRSLYSRNIRNLFLAGRIFSASHVAFSSTRVQATLASAAQAVARSAVLCIREKLQPADVSASPHIRHLQRDLLRTGQCIPHVRLDDPDDLARHATITSSSTLWLDALPDDGPVLRLEHSWAQMLPVQPGEMPQVTFILDVSEPTELQLELRTSDRPEDYTPDVIVNRQIIALQPGQNQPVTAHFETQLDATRYIFVCLMKNSAVAVHTTNWRITGLLAVSNTQNPAVSNFGAQQPDHDIGIETFEFWVPLRRPQGHNLAVRIDPPLAAFDPAKVDTTNNGP